MKTAVMTDTNSGLSVEDGKRFGIFVLPMPVLIDDRCFFEGRDISYETLWKAFEEKKEIRTSMPSPGDLADMWDRILEEEGYDELVYIPMTSGLSGSCQAAAAAAGEYGGRVVVIDNRRISYTQMNSVFDALEMTGRGIGAREIKETLEKETYLSTIYITVNSVKYLVKSGRVTEAGARIADILHLKPVLQIQGERLDAYAKARGTGHAADKMIAALRHDLETRFAGIPGERISIGTAGTLRTMEERESWRQRIASEFPGHRVMYTALPCSIASHVGVDTFGTAATVIHYDEEKYVLN